MNEREWPVLSVKAVTVASRPCNENKSVPQFLGVKSGKWGRGVVVGTIATLSIIFRKYAASIHSAWKWGQISSSSTVCQETGPRK